MGHSSAANKRANVKYENKPEQIKKRENRNKARYQMEKAGKAKKGDGKDVMHKNGNALDNKPSNWKMGSQHKNRAYARTAGAHKKNPRS
jgi:hypothetical protein